MSNRWVILAIVGLVWIVKGVLIWGEWIAFNADESIVALMARHILQGGRPVFFYGQAYMGSLDAWLAAGAFQIFGEAVWPVRLVQGVLYTGTVLSTIWLGRLVFKSNFVANLAGLLMAVPSINVTLYTTASLGGYGETLLIGNLILCLALLAARDPEKGRRYLVLLFIWGLLAGVGVWVLGLTLVYSVPSAVYLAVHHLRDHTRGAKMPGAMRTLESGLAALTGVFLGLLPVWIFVSQNGFQVLVRDFTGGAIAGVEQLDMLSQILRHTQSFLLLGLTVILGMRPPWGVNWLALPLAPFALTFWLAVLATTGAGLLRWRYTGRHILLLGVCGFLVGAFIFTSFGADPSGRYFLPLAAPAALFAAAAIEAWNTRLGRWTWLFPGLVIVYHLSGTVQSAMTYSPGITTQFNPATFVDQRQLPALASFLDANGETRGYSNYWVAYPLAFLSAERLIFAPQLPYRKDLGYTTRDNRYPLYQAEVDGAGKSAYITVNHPELDAIIRQGLEALDVTWAEEQIGDFQVFYDLSRPVRPAEIGLGSDRP